MRGSIIQRGARSWAIIVDERDAVSGKRRRRWHSHKGTRKSAEAECARLIAALKAGTHVDPTRETVAAFLDRWLEHMQGQVSPRSIERYTELARKNLAPLLGVLALSKLQPAHISQAYAKALASGRRDGAGGLSARHSHAPGAARSIAASRGVAAACKQSSCIREAPEGPACRDENLRLATDGRATGSATRQPNVYPHSSSGAVWIAAGRDRGLTLAPHRF